MSRCKRKSKKKLKGQGRRLDAQRWLQSCSIPKDLVRAFSKRYSVSEMEARDELMSMGYYDEILIQEYEKEGLKWEYKYEPLSGEMFVVSEGT